MRKQCVVCGGEFESRWPRARLCSQECKTERSRLMQRRRYAADAGHYQTMARLYGKKARDKRRQTRPCDVCGGPFMPHSRQKTCSTKCHVARQKTKRLARYRATPREKLREYERRYQEKYPDKAAVKRRRQAQQLSAAVKLVRELEEGGGRALLP